MKVYIGFSCYYNYCDVFSNVEKVFLSEEAALVWKEDFNNTKQEFRVYEEHEVEEDF